MLIFIILTVFIAGLMVGRTPEYLGKKVEAFEMKMTILAILAPNVIIKLFSAVACSVPAGKRRAHLWPVTRGARGKGLNHWNKRFVDRGTCAGSGPYARDEQ